MKNEIIVFERYPEDEARYRLERAQLNEKDKYLACLLSAIERDRTTTPMLEPIPIYEELAFALKDPELRRALAEALT